MRGATGTGMSGLSTGPVLKKRKCPPPIQTGAPPAGQFVSHDLQILPAFRHSEMCVKTRQCAHAQACAIVRAVDPLLEQILDVRIITTRRTTGGAVQLSNHVNLRVHNDFTTMIYHERALVAAEHLMFCFMVSSQLEPLVVVVAVHAQLGKLETLTPPQLQALEVAMDQFKKCHRLAGEVYGYTGLKDRRAAVSCHSRHFHLKIRIPTEMYLKSFPAMQVLGANVACKRNVLNQFKQHWEPLAHKFSTETLFPWDLTRLLILSDMV